MSDEPAVTVELLKGATESELRALLNDLRARYELAAEVIAEASAMGADAYEVHD